ncbi:hypothetical protein [Prosthecobacter sp.]|uniref:hypothetical protein n=1 Tax=Prosthecobacter sp. TaxID=1965333 RepID=UPI00378425FC
MNYQLNISITLGSNSQKSEGVVLSDQKLFAQLRSRSPDSSVNPQWFNLQILYDEAVNQKLFEIILAKTGRRPSADPLFVLKNVEKYYYVRVNRLIEVPDLDAAPWLFLTPPPLSLAEFSAVEPDDSYVVAKVKSKKKIAFGSTRTVGWMMLFSDALKDRFFTSGLRGISFQSVKLEDGTPSGLWRLTSHARMPSLAMQLTDGQGNPFPGEESRACCVNEGSYFPMVLKYRENDLADIPNVDVIMSTERIGGGHNAHRMHIVSQQFRQAAEELAPGQFNYSLVAVGEGEELQTRYTIPELAPHRDVS